jgi:hypothetical protein
LHLKPGASLVADVLIHIDQNRSHPSEMDRPIKVWVTIIDEAWASSQGQADLPTAKSDVLQRGGLGANALSRARCISL